MLGSTHWNVGDQLTIPTSSVPSTSAWTQAETIPPLFLADFDAWFQDEIAGQPLDSLDPLILEGEWAQVDGNTTNQVGNDGNSLNFMPETPTNLDSQNRPPNVVDLLPFRDFPFPLAPLSNGELTPSTTTLGPVASSRPFERHATLLQPVLAGIQPETKVADFGSHEDSRSTSTSDQM